MKILTFALMLFISPITGQAASSVCQYFQLHKGFSRVSKRPCSARSLKRDTDFDGISDWKRHPQFGAILYPNDLDIDNDGVPNISDPRPFYSSRTDVTTADLLPYHLQNHRDQVVRRLQKRLFRSTGLYAIEGNVKWNRRQLAVLDKLFRSDFGKQLLTHLTRLKYFLSYSKLGEKPSAGLYLEPIDAIALAPPDAGASDRDLAKTLVHEIGHALLFSKLTSLDLNEWLVSFAGFTESTRPMVASLYHQRFLRRLARPSFRSPLAENFPSSYSHANSHEWFAENFAEYALARMGYQTKVSTAVATAFDELLQL